MENLLGRHLTNTEEAMKAALTRALEARAKGPGAASLASSAPELFLAAALSMLESCQDLAERCRVYKVVAECPEFWEELLRSQRFSCSDLLGICQFLMTIDPLLDVRLARLTPGRAADASQLDAAAVIRILGILNEISPGGRLVLLLNHLTHHPNPHIASKATLLIGKRMRNQDWTVRQMTNPNDRVRANAVEGLWHSSDRGARECLWSGLRDKNNRVVGNALLGLHHMGEPTVTEFVKRMLEDARPPFRWTAAWVMGKIGSEEFIELLERAQEDPNAQVRTSAERALTAIRERVKAAADAQTKAAEEAETEATEAGVEPELANSEAAPEDAASPPVATEAV